MKGKGKVNVEQAIELYKQGFTLEQIGRLFGVTREGIRQHLARRGYTRLDGGITERRTQEVEYIEEASSKGATIEEIAKELDTSVTKIRNLVVQHNIDAQSDYKKHNKEIFEEIKKLHDQGLSQSAIAKKINYSQTFVSKVLVNEYGIKSKNLVDNDDAKRMYKEGYSMHEIAKKYGVTYAQVYNILKYKFNALPESNRGKVTEEKINEIIDLKKQGVSVPKISKQLSLGESTVYKILKESSLRQQRA